MNTRPIVTTVILILICLPWPVGAQQSVGVRAGVSADPDQFLFGGHLETGPLLERLSLASRLLNTRIGLGMAIMRVTPPRQRCARGHAVPTRGPATPAAGDQGHLASRFRNRTKL